MRLKLIIAVSAISTIAIITSNNVAAQPYGAGTYNSTTPYGGETSLSISTASAVNFTINPASNGAFSSASGAVTVYSTDVSGYKLYIRAIGTSAMTMPGSTIPASANATPAALGLNTWGYNTTGSTTLFTGVTTTDSLLKNASGPYSAGDATTVTYGLNLDLSKPAGSYAANLVYTAVPQTN